MSKYIAGDFPPGTKANETFGSLILMFPRKGFHLSAELLVVNGRVRNITLITEENKYKITGAIGWGAVGLVLLGPIGAIAGLFGGGRRAEVGFLCELMDGRRFMATASTKTYQALFAETLKFSSSVSGIAPDPQTTRKPPTSHEPPPLEVLPQPANIYIAIHECPVISATIPVG